MNKYKLVTPSRVRTDQRVARDFLALVSGPLEMLLALLVFTKREIRLAILQALVKYFEIHDAEAEVSTTGAHDQNAPNLRLDGAPVLSLNDILPDLCADAGLPPPPGKLELRLPQLALLPLAGAPAQRAFSVPLLQGIVFTDACSRTSGPKS